MKLYGWLGLLLLLISEYCLFHRIEPFYSWFYCFAWWSYILLADNLLLKLSGGSLFTTRRSELWTMLPLSVFIWLIFEGYNLVLRNWSYNSVPSQTWVRWSGYSVAFATVLPGIFITADLIGFFLAGSKAPSPSRCEEVSRPAPRPSLLYMGLGVFLSIAPIVWPRYFFPAVWIGPIFLLDPLLEISGIQSLSLSIASNRRHRIWSLLLGGAACGLMWEFWNFWAASKWLYSVPFFGDWKVFEMPVFGFLGFPPFALECWVLYHLMRALSSRSEALVARAALWFAIGLLCAMIFRGIDRYTVLHFVQNISGSVHSWHVA